MANCVTIDNGVPVYHSREATRALAYLDAQTKVETSENIVDGPPGHGKIQQAQTPKGKGWIYLSQLQCG